MAKKKKERIPLIAKCKHPDVIELGSKMKDGVYNGEIKYCKACEMFI